MSFLIGQLAFPEIDPVAVRLGPLAVRWYGVAYILGFLAAYLGLRQMIRRGALRITEGQLSDLITWVVVGVMAGGRLGWWLFYHRAAEGPEPWYEPIALWHGGMSFHGGLIGVAIAVGVWSRVRHVDFWNLGDGVALVAPLGLCFGRIANFINAELVGRSTNVPWGIIFPGENFARHPSQLYEALLEGPILLVLLWAAKRILEPRDGRIAGLFFIAYGVIRFGVEFTREPDDQLGFIALGWVTMGQLLSAVLVLIGMLVWWHHPRERTQPLATKLQTVRD